MNCADKKCPDIEALLYMVADWNDLTGELEYEIGEEALEHICAAANIPDYYNFLQRIKKE